MDSHRSTSCRTHEIMRINECVVEHRTVQHVNQLFYIIHVALILFVLWYCAMFDSYNPDCFWTMDRLIKDDHHHVLRPNYRCVPNHRNVQDVCIQCHADELMCMICCAMSHTFEYSGYQQLNHCMHHVLQWDQWTTPGRDAIKKPPTSCRAYEIMRMMWCVRKQSSVSQLIFCLMFLSGWKSWFQIGLHYVVRTRSCASMNALSNTGLSNA